MAGSAKICSRTTPTAAAANHQPLICRVYSDVSLLPSHRKAAAETTADLLPQLANTRNDSCCETDVRKFQEETSKLPENDNANIALNGNDAGSGVPDYEQADADLLGLIGNLAYWFAAKFSWNGYCSLTKMNAYIFQIVFFVVVDVYDLLRDCYLAYVYFNEQKYWFGGLTLAFFIVPGWIIAGRHLWRNRKEMTTVRNTGCYIFSFLCLTPSVLYISIFYYCRKIKESNQHEVELRHVSFLSCMESGPQMYLQWYIVGYYDDATISDTIKFTLQLLSLLNSSFSFTWALVNRNRYKDSTDFKIENMDVGTTVLIWDTICCSLLGRAFLLIEFAKAYIWIFIPMCIFHSFFVFGLLWFSLQDDSSWKNKLQCIPKAFIHLFVDYNVFYDPHTKRSTFKTSTWIPYYTVFFLENSLSIFGDSTFISRRSLGTILGVDITIACFVLFFWILGFMSLFFTNCYFQQFDELLPSAISHKTLKKWELIVHFCFPFYPLLLLLHRHPKFYSGVRNENWENTKATFVCLFTLLFAIAWLVLLLLLAVIFCLPTVQEPPYCSDPSFLKWWILTIVSAGFISLCSNKESRQRFFPCCYWKLNRLANLV